MCWSIFPHPLHSDIVHSIDIVQCHIVSVTSAPSGTLICRFKISGTAIAFDELWHWILCGRIPWHHWHQPVTLLVSSNLQMVGIFWVQDQVLRPYACMHMSTFHVFLAKHLGYVGVCPFLGQVSAAWTYAISDPFTCMIFSLYGQKSVHRNSLPPMHTSIYGSCATLRLDIGLNTGSSFLSLSLYMSYHGVSSLSEPVDQRGCFLWTKFIIDDLEGKGKQTSGISMSMISAAFQPSCDTMRRPKCLQGIMFCLWCESYVQVCRFRFP